MSRDSEIPTSASMAARRETLDSESVNEDLSGRDDVVYDNDDLDDVFGSAPPSPVLEHGAQASTGESLKLKSGNLEPSDIPRLKEKHETEGYRDGVTRGKAESVQAGFDEGYGLGAVLGLKIGRILGIFEGLVKAIHSGSRIDKERWRSDQERLDGLWLKAREELGTVSVFGRDYWGADGIWIFPVPGEEKGEVVFPDVAEAHPLVKKWQEILDQEVNLWGLDLRILEGEYAEEAAGEGIDGKRVSRDEQAQPIKESAAEAAPPPGKIMGISKAALNW